MQSGGRPCTNWVSRNPTALSSPHPQAQVTGLHMLAPDMVLGVNGFMVLAFHIAIKIQW